MKLTIYKQKYESVEDNRNTFLGGSDMGTVLGLNPFKSAYTLYLEKTGQKDVEDISDNESIWWGTEMEDAVARRFVHKFNSERDDGIFVTANKTTFEYRCKEYPFLVAHVDRLVTIHGPNGIGNTKCGLECKTTSAYNRTDYEAGDIPAAHYAQVQFYMAMTGYHKWFYAVKRDHEFYWTTVLRDDLYIETMLSIAEDFWAHVQAKDDGIPVDGSKSTAESLNDRWKADPEELIEMSADEYTEICRGIETYTSSIKECEDHKARLQNQLKDAMKTASVGLNNDYKITWKTQQKKGFDQKRFIAENPDLAKKYETVTESRVLRVTKKKGN